MQRQPSKVRQMWRGAKKSPAHQSLFWLKASARTRSAFRCAGGALFDEDDATAAVIVDHRDIKPGLFLEQFEWHTALASWVRRRIFFERSGGAYGRQGLGAAFRW